MESTDSSSGSQQPQLPPGFRFHPTDEELVVHYLKKKVASAPLPVAIIAEVDLYKFDPWELPAKASFGEEEWYFFSPRERKYPNGARPNRAATSGYWKATGTDKPVLTTGGTQKVGVKKALVFYGGKPPKGIKTNWIMHEYRIADNNNKSTNYMKPPGWDIANNKSGSLRLDDLVLCRIYKKKNSQRPLMEHESSMLENMTNNNNLSVSGTSNSQLSPSVMSIKRSLFWDDDEDPSSSNKRFLTTDDQNHEDGRRTVQEDNGSMASFFGPFPQQEPMPGNLGDGVFRHMQPYNNQLPASMNWYS